MSERRVALVSGFWGQNIGNAFFNVGGKWVLEQVMPEHQVAFIQDQPGYRTFNNQHKGNPVNDLGLLQYLDCEAIVLQGPMLTTSFRALWEPTFKALRERGTKVILLSAALFRYTQEEIDACRKFLTDYPPAILSTRDTPTYDALKDCCEHAYCGIDSALFVPRVYQPFRLTLEPYVTINFDRFPEPTITLGDSAEEVSRHVQDRQFEALGRHWGLRFPKLQWWASSKGKAKAYLGALLDRRRLPTQLGPWPVVRTEHRVNPHVTWKVYQQRHVVASDEPFTYFTVYGNTQLTISDRVHACVATLAYGAPAMLLSPSPRSHLFDRLGLSELRQRPMTLPPEQLRDEQERELDFLREAVRAVL